MRLLSEIRNYIDNYHVKSGVYHYYRNEFSQAVGFLRKALADENGLREGDRRTARGYLTRSLKGLGEKLAAEGDLEEAVTSLRQAASVDPSYPDVHFLAARLLEQNGHTEQAIEAYHRAIACQPTYLDAYVALGHCLLASGRLEEARSFLGRALELKLDQVRRPFERGIEALTEGQADAAREWFHEAFRSVPLLAKEYMGNALMQIRAEEYERALVELDRALELNPKYPDLHNFRGIVLTELERHEEAFVHFRRSAELRPSHMVPRLNLAFALLRSGRLAGGEEELTAILEQDPDEPVARAKLDELRSARISERPGAGARS